MSSNEFYKKQNDLLKQRIDILERQLDSLALNVMRTPLGDQKALDAIKGDIQDRGFCILHGKFFCDEH